MIMFGLAIIGFATIIVVAVMLVMWGAQALGSLINRIKMRHLYKHRFDKPPTAKCYCIDCRHFNKCSGECYSHTGWRMAENWFCWDAEPRDKE
jgi:hypothetical protein